MFKVCCDQIMCIRFSALAYNRDPNYETLIILRIILQDGMIATNCQTKDNLIAMNNHDYVKNSSQFETGQQF